MKKWSADLELGIGFIDRAHKEIFDIFERIDHKKDSIDDQLLNLLIHLKYYFADEENLLILIIPTIPYIKRNMSSLYRN